MRSGGVTGSRDGGGMDPVDQTKTVERVAVYGSTAGPEADEQWYATEAFLRANGAQGPRVTGSGVPSMTTPPESSLPSPLEDFEVEAIAPVQGRGS